MVIVDGVVPAHGMPPHVTAMFEHFAAQFTFEFGSYAALVVQVLVQSGFVFVRSAASVWTPKPPCAIIVRRNGGQTKRLITNASVDVTIMTAVNSA